ncbi:putative mitochondrial ribosomal protein of the large subunit [Scheffersomyces amazonensis]|uniref:putative mitochondrial ribosomal protein of the large subunit n=1 Tax=Scheffersomyces amazonensis TaxID=1078765 RepID=UPI00315D6488
MSHSLRNHRVGTLIKNFQRFESTGVSSNPKHIKEVWSNFQIRPTSLKIDNTEIKKGIFNKVDENRGPLSISEVAQRLTYHSPNEIDETFKQAYEILQNKANETYTRIQSLEKKLNQTDNELEQLNLKNTLDKLKIEAEKENPEVLYNVNYNSSDSLDKSHPVYRYYLKDKWQNQGLMLTMQRLETLHVIPDTLPTFEPSVEVKVKFPHNKDPEFGNWITPGDILPAFAVEQPPTISIQEFDRIDGQDLYTIVLVNPDTPDLVKNSFSTTLHYGLTNVSLNNVDNIIGSEKLLENQDSIIFKPYLPILPEKNAGKYQRACLWVFKQTKELTDLSKIEREDFNIRSFSKLNDLIPVGAHVWRQHFDRSVPSIREKYGLGKGRVFHRVRGTTPVPNPKKDKKKEEENPKEE